MFHGFGALHPWVPAQRYGNETTHEVGITLHGFSAIPPASHVGPGAKLWESKNRDVGIVYPLLQGRPAYGSDHITTGRHFHRLVKLIYRFRAPGGFWLRSYVYLTHCITACPICVF